MNNTARFVGTRACILFSQTPVLMGYRRNQMTRLGNSIVILHTFSKVLEQFLRREGIVLKPYKVILTSGSDEKVDEGGTKASAKKSAEEEKKRIDLEEKILMRLCMIKVRLHRSVSCTQFIVSYFSV